MKKALVMIAMATLGMTAHAHQPCGIDFSVENPNFAIQIPVLTALAPISPYELTGYANIQCGNNAPVRARMVVKADRFLSIALGPAKLAGVASGIGVTNDARGLMGEYLAVGAQAVLVGANLALHAQSQTHNSATLDLSLNVGIGLGQAGVLHIYLSEIVPTPPVPPTPVPPTPRGT